MIKDYELVIGLEVHIEMSTKTKIFCSCSTEFGADANMQSCPGCMGLPGTLPVLNEKVVEYGVRAGLATNCRIANYSVQDRKSYFYPDLPKAYQVSQNDRPLCIGGHIDIETSGGTKRIGITRIHIEEDAGKLVHEDGVGTLIDCNRGGMPLIEIVSEPDMRSAEDVKAYLQKLRAIIVYTGVSDCKMNEGHMRCDVNLSVRKIGDEKLGVRTEIKNLNSIAFAMKAIEYEYNRHVNAVESGELLVQETRRFDVETGKTYAMRNKENATDYRYFPDPDLPIIYVSDERIAEIKASIPELPDARKAKYIEKYELTPYDGEFITSDLAMAEFFESVADVTKYPKLAANMIISELVRLVESEGFTSGISAGHMAELSDLAGDGTINSSTAKRLIKDLWLTNTSPKRFVADNNLAQISDPAVLLPLIIAAINANPKSVADFKNGKFAASKAIVGQIMAKTQGRANPIVVNELVEEELKK